MHCPSCQALLSDDAAFCHKCGARITTGIPERSSDPLRTALEQAVGSQYDIQRLLGRGGMGAVYLARERTLDRLVALKVLPPELALGARTDRFRREARIAAKLTHPNIVPLHAFGEFEGMVYLVMGYVRGESLGDRMRREGKLPPEEARRILAELADALDYAHRQGVVHRDIKPDNILLDDESGRPMLTDFGIAKFRAAGETVTETGIAMGTPHYISPEQAGGQRDLDGRSDLYSLGVVGYAMLSGRLPFEGESYQELIAKHMTQDPPPLVAVAPGVPVDLGAAVMRCLHKRLQDRWPDGKSFREALGLTLSEDEDWLPGELREVSAALFWITAGGWLWGSLVWLQILWLHPGAGNPWGQALLAALIVPGAFLLTAAVHRRKGYSWRQMARVAKWPPKWWPFAWPRSWRRPGDVWDRLPRGVRLMRSYYGLVVCSGLLALPLLASRGARPAIRGGFPLLVLFTVGTLINAWWAHRNGFPNNADLRSLFFGSTTQRRFWKQPHVARLLLPATPLRERPGAREPGAPYEYLTAIGDAAQQLTGPVREIGSQALAGARQLLSVLQRLDHEIETLAHDADPAEIERLEQKLVALGDEHSSEPESRHQMRQLLQGQLDLVHRLAVQLDAATTRRAQLLGLLRTLWLQLANLRAATAAGALDSHEVTAPIRALCQEIERHAAATEEVMRALIASTGS